MRRATVNKDVKLIVLVFSNFVYSVSLIGVVFFYSLMGVVATDKVGIIITEATGFQRQETLLTANLLPAELHTLFWLSLAGAALCIIFVVLLQHTFRSLYGPGALSFIVFFLLTFARGAVMNFLPPVLEQAGSTPYLISIVERSAQANGAVFFSAILLFYLAYRGDKFFLKKN
jgi:hypothetical protein